MHKIDVHKHRESEEADEVQHEDTSIDKLLRNPLDLEQPFTPLTRDETHE